MCVRVYVVIKKEISVSGVDARLLLSCQTAVCFRIPIVVRGDFDAYVLYFNMSSKGVICVLSSGGAADLPKIPFEDPPSWFFNSVYTCERIHFPYHRSLTGLTLGRYITGYHQMDLGFF